MTSYAELIAISHSTFRNDNIAWINGQKTANIIQKTAV